MTESNLYHHSQTEIQEELDLIRRAQSNSRDFGVLYNKYYVAIFRFVLKRVGNQDDSASVVSDIFVKALQNLANYEYKGVPFSAWLFQIARNEVNQYYRKLKKDRWVTLETHHLEEVLEEMNEETHEEQIKTILDHLCLLGPEELELLEMRYFEKRPFKEVSEILEISEGTAKVRMHRVLAKLKNTILKK